MHISSIAELLGPVQAAGAVAEKAQRASTAIERRFKPDGTVLTDLDQQVEDLLYAEIAGRYPQANILTEETARSFDGAKPYTFAVDPIDGTDVFSQGMVGWCVAVGLLDSKLVPVAGIVFAPRLELLLLADVGAQATCNGQPIVLAGREESLSARSSLMVSSQIHHQVDLTGYPGRVRGLGSAALHFCFPLIYSGVVGTLEQRPVYIWDLAAAHAIVTSCGQRLEYLDGRQIDYGKLVGGGGTDDVILCGSAQVVAGLRDLLVRR